MSSPFKNKSTIRIRKNFYHCTLLQYALVPKHPLTDKSAFCLIIVVFVHTVCHSEFVVTQMIATVATIRG
jgi:hypothetical protein